MVIKEKRTLTFIVVVLAVFGAATFLGHSPRKHDGFMYSLPPVIGQWQGSEVSFNRSLLTSWLGTDRMVFREYRNREDGRAVTIYLAYYPNMEASDMAHAPEVCYPGQGWSIVSDEPMDLVLSDSSFRVKHMIIEKDTAREVVYSWWQTPDEVVAANWQYRLHMVVYRLLMKDTASLWVRISSDDNGGRAGEPSTGKTINAFCSEVFPLLKLYFQTRD